MEEKLLTVSENVLKFRNSSTRYLRIPGGHFKDIKHGDNGEVAMISNENEIKIIYIFKRRK